MQVKLLRAIQEGEIEPVGGTPRKVDFRLVCATNRNLAEDVKAGRFREDLFYRINVVPLYVPPLRDHAEDVPLLAEHFLQVFRDRHQSKVTSISDEAMAALCRYGWPGNVRELENAVERAVVLCRGEEIGVENLPAEVRTLAGRARRSGGDTAAGGGAAYDHGDLEVHARDRPRRRPPEPPAPSTESSRPESSRTRATAAGVPRRGLRRQRRGRLSLTAARTRAASHAPPHPDPTHPDPLPHASLMHAPAPASPPPDPTTPRREVSAPWRDPFDPHGGLSR